ncbi:MAG TPA: allantoinase [Chloroflexota bacterium]|nr:allantoinase [Chloroflexota bacterium]
MNRYDLLLRGGTLVVPDGLSVADLAVAGGRIVAIGPDLEGTAAESIDATGLHVFPGIIDAHVHFNEPGRAEWEGFATGSRALATGGGTLFFDMPLNAHPPTVTAEAFDQKHAAAEASSIVDFALWGGLVPGNLADLEPLAERGVIGFKAFMSNSGIDDFAAVDDDTLFQGMRIAARLGRIVAVHAENDAITAGLARRAMVEGRVGARDYLASRPVIAELEAINRAITLAAEAGCALHIVHVSSGRGVELVAEAHARGVDVSCETCPHYLVLTEDDVERLGAVAKCAPPLRPQMEIEALWEHLRTGALPMVASDHSPAPASMKTSDDFFRVWGGISGCQHLLALLLAEGHDRRGIDPSTLSRRASGFAAERFGLAPNRGTLAVGASADLALVDLAATFTVTAGDLRYRHPHSPYVGREVRGRVVRTVVRGITVQRDGVCIDGAVGRLVTPGSCRE